MPKFKGSRNNNSLFWNTDPSCPAALRKELRSPAIRPFPRLAEWAPQRLKKGSYHFTSTPHVFAGFFLGLIISCSALATDPITINPAHPERYVVVEGDTLWDIAGRFLSNPWRWSDVWHVNPKIENPHLLYPGDTVVLTYINGRPRLSLERSSIVKLSPQIHIPLLSRAIPTIPVDAIQQFLIRPYVVDDGELEGAPYILDFADEHLMGSTGIRIYVRSIKQNENSAYDIVRPGKAYKDADTDEILGYEALYIGGARLQRIGNPATLLLTSTESEVLVGDRLLPSNQNQPLQTFHPKAPDIDIQGSIISVLHGISQIGQYYIVVLDRGTRDGLEAGDILTIDRRGETVRDLVTSDPQDTAKLPNEPAGSLMVFRTFPRVSFALVMYASRALHVLDRVHTP